MASITIDTLKYAQQLQQAGVPHEQAKVFSEVQKNSLSEVLGSQLATRSDIHLLELRLERIEGEIRPSC